MKWWTTSFFSFKLFLYFFWHAWRHCYNWDWLSSWIPFVNLLMRVDLNPLWHLCIISQFSQKFQTITGIPPFVGISIHLTKISCELQRRIFLCVSIYINNNQWWSQSGFWLLEAKYIIKKCKNIYFSYNDFKGYNILATTF